MTEFCNFLSYLLHCTNLTFTLYSYMHCEGRKRGRKLNDSHMWGRICSWMRGNTGDREEDTNGTAFDMERNGVVTATVVIRDGWDCCGEGVDTS